MGSSAVPSGLVWLWRGPGVKTPGYCRLFRRNRCWRIRRQLRCRGSRHQTGTV